MLHPLRLLLTACLVTGTAVAQTGPAPPAASPSATPPRVISLPGVAPQSQLYIKPGHWLAARVDLWAGENDLRGTLAGGWLDENDAPLTYPPLRYRLRSEQPAVVPKKSERGLEQLLFVPNDYDTAGPPRSTARNSHLHGSLGLFRLGDVGPLTTAPEVRAPTAVLRDHQALFVVLAARPSDYAFLTTFDAITTPHSPTPFPESAAHYRLLFADPAERPALPSSIQGWTTTAYVLWDGYDLAKLSDEQRTALVDWLHWGGTLIVAGPGTLDLPVADPLRSWLPAASAGVRELAAADLVPLAEATILGDTLKTANRTWGGLRLEPHPAARVLLGTVKIPLVIERRLGRGRVIVTAFRPTQSELLAWPSYPGLFNTHLMRRPPRVWTLHPTLRDLAIASWADAREIPNDSELRQGAPDRWFDPGRITSLRFFGRGDITTTSRRTLFDLERPLGPGVASWRDDDEVSAAAREAIRAASGIFIPSAGTVSLLIGGYVLFAIPLNWIVFRYLRKPEWAWAALPLISVFYTIVIISAAELDLGFVRSTSETTLIEIQPKYDRAHVTRFTSLFNSLGTEYRLVGEDPTTMTLPFPLSLDAGASQSNRSYRLVRSDDESGKRTTTLIGTVVDSNSIAAARSEQMASLGGKLIATLLRGGRVRLENKTRLELRDLRLLGAARGTLAVLAPGETAEFGGTPLPDATPDDLVLESFRKLFARSIPASAEALLLTAWTPTELAGLRIEPEPSQRRRQAIVVAVLQYGEEPPPARDANTRRFIEAQLPQPPNPFSR